MSDLDRPSMGSSDDIRPEDVMEPVQDVNMDEDDYEYEEIATHEVERVIEGLEHLRETVESDTIKSYLEATCEELAALMEENADDDEEDEQDWDDKPAQAA